MLNLAMLMLTLVALTPHAAFAQTRRLAKPVLGAPQTESRARQVPTRTALVLYDGTDGVRGQMQWTGREKMVSLMDVPNLADIKCGGKGTVTLTFSTRAPARLPWALPVLAFVDDAFEGCGEITVQQDGERNTTVRVPGFLYINKLAKRNVKTLVLEATRKPFNSQISELKFELDVQAVPQSDVATPGGGRRLQASTTVKLKYQKDIPLYSGTSNNKSLVVKCKKCGPSYSITISISGGVKWKCCVWKICVCPKPYASLRLSGSGNLRAELAVSAGYGGSYTFVDQPNLFKASVPILGVSGVGVYAFVALGLQGSIAATVGIKASLGVLIKQSVWEAYVAAGTGESSYVTGGNVSATRIGPVVNKKAGTIGAQLSLTPAFGASLDLIGISLANVRVGLDNQLTLGIRAVPPTCMVQAYAQFKLLPFISGNILGSSASRTFGAVYDAYLFQKCVSRKGRRLQGDGLALHRRALALAA